MAALFESYTPIHTLKNITTLWAPVEASREEGQKTAFEKEGDSEQQASGAKVRSCGGALKLHSHVWNDSCMYIYRLPGVVRG